MFFFFNYKRLHQKVKNKIEGIFEIFFLNKFKGKKRKEKNEGLFLWLAI